MNTLNTPSDGPSREDRWNIDGDRSRGYQFTKVALHAKKYVNNMQLMQLMQLKT